MLHLPPPTPWPQELLEKCNPLGLFDAIASLAVAQNMRDLYRLVLASSGRDGGEGSLLGCLAPADGRHLGWRASLRRAGAGGTAGARASRWARAAQPPHDAPTHPARPPPPPPSLPQVDTPLAPYFSDNLTSEDLDEMNIEVGGGGGSCGSSERWNARGRGCSGGRGGGRGGGLGEVSSQLGRGCG